MHLPDIGPHRMESKQVLRMWSNWTACQQVLPQHWKLWVPGDEGRPPEYDDWGEELRGLDELGLDEVCGLDGVLSCLGGGLPKKPVPACK